MIKKGYKCFNKDKTNRYGIPFEEGKDYHVDGEIRFGNKGNGFHMCVHLSDVFRYFDTRDDNFVVAEVTCSGEYDLREYPDDFEGYYEMYAFSDMHIDRFISREEIIEKMLVAPINDVKKFLRTFVLGDKEALLFLRKYCESMEIISIILYYHYGEKEIYYLSVDEREDKLKKVKKYGQDNS